MGVAVLANLSPLGAWRPESTHTLANDSQEPVQTRLVFMAPGPGNLKKPASGVSLSRKRASYDSAAITAPLPSAARLENAPQNCYTERQRRPNFSR